MKTALWHIVVCLYGLTLWGCATYREPSQPVVVQPTPVRNDEPMDTKPRNLGNGWWEVVGIASMTERGQEAAEAKARQKARAEAVALASGVEVIVHELLVMGGFELFSSLSQQQSAGRVDEEELVGKPEVFMAGGQAMLQVRLRCHVTREAGQRDPAFVVHAELNQQGAKPSFRSGEEVIVRLESSLDGHATVLNLLPDGAVEVLYPHEDLPYEAVQAGEPFEMPSAQLRAMDVRLRKQLEGDQPHVEALLVVVSRDRVPFRKVQKSEAAGMTQQRADFLDVQRWLLDIPLDRRREVVLPHYVVP